MDSRDEHPLPAPADLPGLSRDLKAAYARPVNVPPAVESAILAMHPAPTRSRRWRIGGWAAAAATVLLALVVVYRPRLAIPVATLRGDVDHSGRVDILDALVLAKSVDGGSTESFDLTGDGRTDAQDVGAIANAAVSLGGGTL